MSQYKENCLGPSLTVQWLRLLALNSGSMVSIPCQRTKILHTHTVAKKKKNSFGKQQYKEEVNQTQKPQDQEGWDCRLRGIRSTGAQDLIDIYRTFHPKTINFTFFSSAYGTFSRIDHILGHKSSFGKFKKTEIIPVIFSDHNEVRLGLSYKKYRGPKSASISTCEHRNLAPPCGSQFPRVTGSPQASQLVQQLDDQCAELPTVFKLQFSLWLCP